MNTTGLKTILLKIEPIIFLIVVCFNLYPLCTNNYLDFMDAPAHLYNANLIKQLVFNHSNTFLEGYIQFNPVFVPNWFCHIIMAPLMLVFPPIISEKILLLCFFVGLPFAARYCISTINKNQKYIALLIIPFTYNFLSMIAFYNFSLGLIFMFLTIGFFYKKFTNLEIKWHAYLVLFLLLLITYLCHIVVLGITVLYVSLIYLWHLISTYQFNLKNWFSAKTIKLIIVVMPIIILMGVYYKTIHSVSKDFTYLNKQELFSYFKDARMFTIFNGNEEQNWSNFLSLFYLSTFFIALYLFFIRLDKIFYKKISLYFLFAIITLLFLYLFLPDSDGLAGYVSIRISMLVFILSILFISSCTLENKYLIPLCFLIVFVHFKRLNYYNEVIKQTNLTTHSVIEQSKLVESNSFIISFKHDDNWLSGHYSNYLGLNRNIICLENYECSAGYFPLVWKDRDKMWEIQQSLSSFQNIESIKKQINQSAVYYWILGDLNSKSDSITVKFKQNLMANCTLINATEVSSLYKLK